MVNIGRISSFPGKLSLAQLEAKTYSLLTISFLYIEEPKRTSKDIHFPSSNGIGTLSGTLVKG